MIENITEYAINKKLFGGGKRGGTAIPVGQTVDRIYFNTENTAEETNALLSQLTYVQTPLLPYPLYAVYANTVDGDAGSFVIVVDCGGGVYNISIIEFISTSASTVPYNSAFGTNDIHRNGWWKTQVGNTFYFADCAKLRADGMTLTNFNGIPVGAENEKIKNVLSITPF